MGRRFLFSFGKYKDLFFPKEKGFVMKERIFIQKAKELVNLQEFIRKQFTQAKCGEIEIQHTPIVTRIVIHTTTPGLVIGTGGEKIRETAELLKQKFKIENPQIDVQKIMDPDMNPAVVAQAITAAIESGVNYKRLGNQYLQRIMESGAIGCEIVFSGKVSGQRSRTQRFSAGYLKKAGDPAMKDVITGFAVASPKLGSIGITVKIMINQPELITMRKIEEKNIDAAPEAAKASE